MNAANSDCGCEAWAVRPGCACFWPRMRSTFVKIPEIMAPDDKQVVYIALGFIKKGLLLSGKMLLDTISSECACRQLMEHPLIQLVTVIERQTAP